MNVEAQFRAVCCDLVYDVGRSTGEVRLKVTGASMLPAVWPGDVVTVRHCGVAEFQPGQIILYRRAGKLTLHRVARVVGDQVIARGDSLSGNDPAVREDEIVGKAVSILRRGKSIDLEQSSLQRVASWILRHSEFCTLLVLRVGGRLRRVESGCEAAALPTVVK